MQIEDPQAVARSIMSNKKEICSGQKTGVPCKHYWSHWAKVLSGNSDFLRDGQRFRACLISPGFPVEFSEETVPHTCNQYQKRKKPGLLGILGQCETYDAAKEDYNPVSTEERKHLEEQVPTTEIFSTNVNAMTANIADIAERKKKKRMTDDETEDSLDPDEVTDFLAQINKKDPK